MLDGKDGATGTIVLNWSLPISRPSNDDFASAHVLSGAPASTSPGCTCDNIGAKTEPGEPDHAAMGTRSGLGKPSDARTVDPSLP